MVRVPFKSIAGSDSPARAVSQIARGKESMNMRTARKWYVLFALSLVIAFVTSVYAERVCKKKTISALPHSFSGVDRCEDDNEWAKEAQNRCVQKLKEVFPPSGFTIRELYTPQYKGSYTMENECTRRVAGVCVDYRRVCKATFSLLNCSALICQEEF